jgi:uncharacterized protein (DUF2249 family)
MVINANTKISSLIRENPAVIDAIASINAHFKKLQNPLLRKIFASRVTIGDAARIGKCDVDLFYKKLQPLGFSVSEADKKLPTNTLIPTTHNIAYDVMLDVRADINEGKDPFKRIMQAINALPAGNVLLLVNSFEPVPLICILKEKGYTAEVIEKTGDEVHTFFRKSSGERLNAGEAVVNGEQFGAIANKFFARMQYIDVRQLPMPQPMMAILKALDTLPRDSALYVYHKKIPMFLLPELKERQYQSIIRHTAEGVELIIYKDEQ